MIDTSNNIWLRTGGNYNRAKPTKLAWLTRREKCRYERLRQARLLFAGCHREYYLDEERTQFNFPEVKANGSTIKLYAALNVLGLISNKSADLLFGEKPSVRVDDDAVQKSIDAIFDRSALHQALFSAAVEASWAAESFLEIIRDGATPGVRAGAVHIAHVPATEIYPGGDRGPDGQYRQYTRYAEEFTTQTIDGRQTELHLLLETIYTPGLIRRRCYRLKQNPTGATRDGEISLAVWPVKRSDGSPLPPEEPTGLSRVSIVWIPNQLIGGECVSDYDGLIEPQDVLNAKHTQISRVLAKHSDPKLRAPRSAADENGTLPSDHDVLFTEDGAPGDGGYGYLTWDAKLDQATKDRDFALHTLCTLAEFPASVLGMQDSAADDSARKVRLKATPALAKAARKAAFFQSGIRLAMSIALEAELGTAPGLSIAVEMRDGLPEDELDRSTVIATLRGAGVMSTRRALQMQYMDPAAIKEEIADLEAEKSAATPSVLFGEPGQTNEAADVAA